jgi:hypothetical protein
MFYQTVPVAIVDYDIFNLGTVPIIVQLISARVCVHFLAANIQKQDPEQQL